MIQWMGNQPVSPQRGPQADALSNARTSYTVAQVSEMLRSALRHT